MHNPGYNEAEGPRHQELVKVRELIENSFMFDWAIRIEYAAGNRGNGAEWVKWQSFFAVTDSEQIVEKIIECCQSNPDCSMKLVCEHFNPGYRFIYCLSHHKSTDTNH